MSLNTALKKSFAACIQSVLPGGIAHDHFVACGFNRSYNQAALVSAIRAGDGFSGPYIPGGAADKANIRVVRIV